MVTLLSTSFPSCQSGVNCVTQHPFCWDEKQVFNSNDLAYWGKSNRAGVLLKCSPISEDNFFRKVQLEIWDDESWRRFCWCWCWWCSIILDGSKVLKVARRRCSSGKWETLVVQIIRLTKTISGSIERNSITTNIFLSLYNFFFLSYSLYILLLLFSAFILNHCFFYPICIMHPLLLYITSLSFSVSLMPWLVMKIFWFCVCPFSCCISLSFLTLSAFYSFCCSFFLSFHLSVSPFPLLVPFDDTLLFIHSSPFRGSHRRIAIFVWQCHDDDDEAESIKNR